MPQFINFLQNWQELTGAFLGSSIAVLLSGIGYLIVRSIERRTEDKETLRKIEVGSTYSLNSIYSMEQKLRIFVKSLRKLIAEIEAVKNPMEYSIQTVNFPSLGEIYLDTEIPHFRVKSYYLHNKLLWIHAGLQNVNGIIADLKGDFERVIRLNEMLIGLMKDQPNPPLQRKGYAENLTLFADEIERFANAELKKGVKPLLQIKAYNEKLRGKFGKGAFARWKHEGASFKYFKDRAALNKFRSLDGVDRIDSEIEIEVSELLTSIQEREKMLSQFPKDSLA